MRRFRFGFRTGVALVALFAALVWVVVGASAAPPNAVQRVNVAYDGGLANGEGQGGLACSADGRYVAFASSAGNIIEGDTNGRYDIFFRDMESQETTLVNVTTDGGFAAQGATNSVQITPDGRYVLFTSDASNLVPGDTNGYGDVFVRDMVSQETTRVNIAVDGTQANYYPNGDGSISDDGRYVVFGSSASSLFPGDVNGRQDCIVKDMQTGAVTNISYAHDGGLGNGHSFYPIISGDGTKVAFVSYATNMVPGDVRTEANLFIRDLGTGSIERVDATTAGGESATEVDINYCDLDYTGRRVVFGSRQTDIVDVPVGVLSQVYLRDTESDETTVVARTVDANVSNGQCYAPTITSDGRWVSFVGAATNLVADDTNGTYDVFLRDMDSDTIERLNYNENDEQLNGGTYEQRLSDDATTIIFNSWATNIVAPFSPGGRGHIYSRAFRAVNAAPVAMGDSYSTARDVALTVAAPGVLSNDSDSDDDDLAAAVIASPERGVVTLGAAGGFTYTPDLGFSGVDNFTYAAHDGTVGSNVATVTITVTLPPVIPIAGANRADTAIKASMEAYPAGLADAGARTVVIATGSNWPDALGGTSLAGALDGPVLLVEKSSMPASVMTEIRRLKAAKAIILGGTGAVDSTVEDALALELGRANVTRIQGSNRYATAANTARKVIEVMGAGYDGHAFVATGGNFPDALAAAPLAAAKGWPLYLSDPASGLSVDTKSAMAGVTDVHILGGSGVVSGATESYLNDRFGDSQVNRLSGSGRYETAVKVADFAVNTCGHEWNRVGVTTGANFPDALAGGVVQGKAQSVMLLTPPDSLDPYAAAALRTHKSAISSVTFYGGTGAVSDGVRTAVSKALE